ncbi:hypothetical protein VIBHAR_05760 [Vibrio campbellii ATCC BAA-1116]|uniref:Uncharacterized protein n=1 Tax=Vibrio campbellii (strain ATCC BAA-1116) TaxID=2902295 RepID=A7N528_VIBC1|nr:hypothetical protein VIBHAR_05760 [Vibrio campbellii ATCC BAA-1116]
MNTWTLLGHCPALKRKTKRNPGSQLLSRYHAVYWF